MKISDPKVDNIIKGLKLRWENGLLITLAKPPAPSFLDETVSTYISFEDVYGSDAENSMLLVLDKIRRYDSIDLIQTLAKINYLLAIDYSKKGKVSQAYLVKYLVSPILQDKTLTLLSSDHALRFLYRHQLLCAIRLAISTSPNAGIQTKDDIYGVGEILLRVSDLFTKDFPTEEEISLNEEKNDEFVAKGMTSVAVSGYEQFRYRLSRYWQIYFYFFQKVKENMPKQHLDIESEFNRATGLDLKAFIGLSFGIWGLYQRDSHAILIRNSADFLISPNNFKNIRPEVRNKICNIFHWVSSRLQDHQQDICRDDAKRIRNPLYAFETIWRRPLLEVSEGNYFPLDMNFMEDKATAGVYGTLHDYYLDKNNYPRMEIMLPQ